MKFVRFFNSENEIEAGWVNDGLVGKVEGDIYGEFRRREAYLPLEQLKLCAPVQPGKILAIGHNYAAHAAEHHAELHAVPLLFLKPPSSVIGPLQSIILPPQSAQVEHEAELAVVMGKRASWVTEEEAVQYILGYTIANDVSARDLQYSDGQWSRAKGFDTFCPIGPWIDTEFDPADAIISCRVNGELRQMSSTKEMVFGVEHLVAYLSTVMTLMPGDVILTGTPAGVGVILAGDKVEIEIEGLGLLSNPVKNRV